ncbi:MULTISPECIES: hypothetical protein [Rhizobium]|uniref:hypothetical protein n=1 Tax=Rhizobium TaxID=379 RepID=UPI001A921A46|nr:MULTISPECIES: hypothetical protein [Rhizobium]MBY3169900.1 hypothetical protein [Rhizobium laguerreae]MBY5558863.1 hypothetical protein [Rhizobium leguminosarum]MBY5727963.1 hypothetical protein [Rhizobium leguminosarum]QSW27014.1 hypothetical protein J0664_26015 [Rhizobium leguminosarum]
MAMAILSRLRPTIVAALAALTASSFSPALANELLPLEIGGVSFSIDLRGGFYIQAQQLGNDSSFHKNTGAPTADELAKLRRRDRGSGLLSATRVGFNLQGDCYTLAKQQRFCKLSRPFQGEPLAITGFDVAPRPGSYSPLREWFVSRRLLSKPGDRWRVEVLTGKAEDGLACFPNWPTRCDYYLLVDGRVLARVGLHVKSKNLEIISSVERAALELIQFYMK